MGKSRGEIDLLYETSKERPPLILEEVTLENFMSYKYAKIPLKPGLNVIFGPNGSGKSSILLGIAVALGQAYTERSRRLSDLVRWGEDIARVTLTFDNSPKNGRRPIPRLASDRLVISRYIRKDGTYWYKLNFRDAAKEEVASLLQEQGIDPDNLLIIMHQGMIEEFLTAPSQQKLKMVEDAVGLRAYRERIFEANKRLNELLSEEESISGLLEDAERTLEHWKGEYEKHLRRKKLLEKLSLLERELAWSRVIEKERSIRFLEKKIQAKRARLEHIARRIERTRELIGQIQQKLDSFTFEQRSLFHILLDKEKDVAKAEVTRSLLNTFLHKLEGEGSLSKDMLSYLKEARSQIKSLEREERRLNEQISIARSKLSRIEEKLSKLREKYIEGRIEEAVLDYLRNSTKDEIARLEGDVGEVQEELKELISLAEEVGPRVETRRGIVDISNDIKATRAYLLSLGEISEDAERMYRRYSSLHEELGEKLATVSENRKMALEEVKMRIAIWKMLLRSLVNKVNSTYNEILSELNAIGRIRLVNLDDIEEAGLELLVGFRGSSPAILDAYTQSGGERSVAITAFLLALQRHIKSPFRAVDEFDIHMDPRNREAIYRFFMSSVNEGFQCMIITPSPLSGVEKDSHLIVTQSVGGVSEAKAVIRVA